MRTLKPATELLIRLTLREAVQTFAPQWAGAAVVAERKDERVLLDWIPLPDRVRKSILLRAMRRYDVTAREIPVAKWVRQRRSAAGTGYVYTDSGWVVTVWRWDREHSDDLKHLSQHVGILANPEFYETSNAKPRLEGPALEVEIFKPGEISLDEVPGKIVMRFRSRPVQAIRSELRACGWRWNPRLRYWWNRDNPDVLAWAVGFRDRHTEKEEVRT